jgi:hypothetical protein
MSSILEIAIGMVFVFSLLSLLVTQINTLILNILNLRAKQLKEGLVRLVSDRELQAKILAHPLIKMVETSVDPKLSLTAEQAEDIIHSKATLVDYIPPGTFVEALISLLASEADNSIFTPLEEAVSYLPNNDQKVRLRELLRDMRSFGATDTTHFRAAILELPNEAHKQALSYTLETVEDSLGRLPVKSGELIPLLEGIRKIKDPVFQTAINTVLITARSLAEARTKLESWFNDGMGRVTEIYKRKIQLISLAVGLALAVILNADSLQILRSFWEDPALRSAVATAARTSSDQLGTQITDANQAQTDAANGQGSLEQSAADLAKTFEQLSQLQLPIGWEFVPVTDEMVLTNQESGLPDPRSDLRNVWNLLPSNPTWASNLIQKIVGLLVTMFAVAQGAPFWFDLLRRIGGGSGSSAQPANVTVNIQRDHLNAG